MAVESKGFSIREYASETRGVDVVKCWPFSDGSDEISKEVVEALLPPITVKKFRWWSDELELVRTTTDEGASTVRSHGESSKQSLDESTLECENVEKEKIELVLDPDAVKLDFVCPICRNFTAPTALAAVSHVDWCLARGLRGEQRMKEMKAKMKAKTPKKRSIVEIFAVAPQVERADSDDDGWEDEDEDDSTEENENEDSKELASCSGGGLNMKYQKGKKPKLKHESTCKMKKQTTTTKVKKKVAESGRYRVDRFLQSIAKEKPRKHKLQSLVKFTAKSKSCHHGKSVLKEIRDAACIHRKKPSLKCLVKMKNKSLGTSKLIKRQKSGFPVCEHHKSGTLGENSPVFSLQHDKQANQRGNLQGDKHLVLSERNTSSRRKRNYYPGPKLSKFPRGCGSNSNAGPTDFVKGDINPQGDEHSAFSDICTSSKPKRNYFPDPELSKCLSDEVISISTGSEKEIPTATMEIQSSEIQPSRISIRRSNIPSLKRPDMSFREYLTESSVTSSQSTLENGSLYTFGQAAPVDPFVGTRPTYLALLKERSDASTKPSVEADIVGASGTIHRGVDYHPPAVSMEHAKSYPQLPSPGFVVIGNANQMIRPPAQTSLANHPSHYLPHQASGHLSPQDLIRSLCSFPDLKQREHMNGNFLNEDLYSLPLNSQGELIRCNTNGKVMMFNSLMRPPSSETNFSRRFPVIPMRRDNTLVSHSRDSNFGGRSGIAINHNPGIDSPSLSLSSSSYIGSSQPGINARRDFQCSDSSFKERNSSIRNPNFELATGKMKYKQVHDPIHVVQPTMRLMGKEFTVGRGSNESQAFEDGRVWTDKQIIAEHQPATAPAQTSSVPKQFQRQVPEVRQNLAFSSGSQVKPPPPPLLRRKRMKPPVWVSRQNPNHLNTMKGNRSTQPPSFRRAPPFMEPIEQFGCGSPTSTSRESKFPHNPTNSTFRFPFLPPDSGQRVHVSQLQHPSMPPWLLNATHQKAPNSSDGSKYHPCAMSPPSIIRTNPEEHPPERNSPSEGHNTMMPHNAEPPGASTHIASIDTVHGDQTSLKERMSSGGIGVKELDQGTKPRKRPGLVSDDSASPAKVENLAVTEAEMALSSGMASLRMEPTVDKAGTVKCGQIETPMNETRSWSPASDSVGMLGPAKLSAGAKHILKPRPKLNQDDSRPTHSTIPFAASVSSSKIQLSEKSCQIYKF